MVNKRTWFAHLFRTQGKDFGFPYPQAATQVDHARSHSRKLWLENTWPGQVYPMSWLINKFAPIPGWHEPVGAKALETIREADQRFITPSPTEGAA